MGGVSGRGIYFFAVCTWRGAMLVLWWSVDVIMCLLSLTGTTARSVRSFLKTLLWEAIVNRTYGAYENLCISLFLPTISGPIYCGPPVVRFRAGESRSEEGGWVSDPVFYLSAKSSSQDYSTHASFFFLFGFRDMHHRHGTRFAALRQEHVLSSRGTEPLASKRLEI